MIITNFISFQDHVIKLGREVPLSGLTAAPVAILDVGADTVKHPLQAIYDLFFAIINTLSILILSPDSERKAIQHGESFLCNVVDTAVAIGLSPFKLTYQFVSLALYPQETSSIWSFQNTKGLFYTHSETARDSLQQEVKSKPIMSRLCFLPLTLLDIGLEITSHMERAAYYAKEAFLNLYIAPIKYVVSEKLAEQDTLQKYTFKDVLKHSEYSLRYVGCTGVAVVMSPIKAIYMAESILFNPTEYQSI